jgi:hypothetical protein
MRERDREHLTPEEIELWAEGLLPAARSIHLSTCEPCLRVAERERNFFIDLARLERFAPSAQLAEKVMARVHIETPVEGTQGR